MYQCPSKIFSEWFVILSYMNVIFQIVYSSYCKSLLCFSLTSLSFSYRRRCDHSSDLQIHSRKKKIIYFFFKAPFICTHVYQIWSKSFKNLLFILEEYLLLFTNCINIYCITSFNEIFIGYNICRYQNLGKFYLE